MALSGSFSGSINSGHYRLRVDWSASQDISGNKSTITANMYLERDYSLYISGRTDNTKGRIKAVRGGDSGDVKIMANPEGAKA